MFKRFLTTAANLKINPIRNSNNPLPDNPINAVQPDLPTPFKFTFRPAPVDTLYKPRDLNDKRTIEKREKSESNGYTTKEVPSFDIFDRLNLDPKKEYKNTSLLSHFVTKMGLIKPRSQTGLSLKNQRSLAKSIKRARAFGLIPYTYKLDIRKNTLTRWN
ncbi:ribosomal protein S18 [Globomyces pollinis-pini]|nr:ribosomal protein S18 [Globomyces pollinis-pini]